MPAADAAGPATLACQACGEPLTVSSPRFEELWGELQNLTAVLEAWVGDARRLEPLVPQRPAFLTDLDPPSMTADGAPALRHALEALRAGSFHQAREALEDLLEPPSGAEARSKVEPMATAPKDEARAWFALGVARQRIGDDAAAEAAYTRALESDPDLSRARLDRAAVRARRGSFAGAREDLAHAGGGPESRWNRAALLVHEAVSGTPGLPDRDRLVEARGWAGPPSAYWSDATVGRLAFTLLAERARVLRAERPLSESEALALCQAEGEVEFATFTDRAMLLATYATLGRLEDAARVARPLALEVAAGLTLQPFVHGATGRPVAAVLEAAERAIERERPAEVLPPVRELLARRDLARYRIPCAACGSGTIGVERLEDASAEADGRPF